MYEIENRPNLKIANLKRCRDHPFDALDENSINEMAESIKNIGIIHPISVRAVNGEKGIYEILSGHKRVQAAKAAGLTTIPAKIYKNLPDSIAMLIVCDTNFFQLSFPTFKHSEKAKSISQYYNALKSQGKRNDLTRDIEEADTQSDEADDGTSAQVMHKSTARDKAVNKFGLDRGTITNYLRVSKLSSELLKRLDNSEFKIAPAVELSYLNAAEQEYLDRVLDRSAYKINTAIATELRSASKESSLSKKEIITILKENKAASNKKFPSFKLSQSLLAQYFKPEQKQEEIEKEISEALEYYRNKPIPVFKRN
jgi:ParB family chromosome partitioning protein